jgi:hypothetical protein
MKDNNMTEDPKIWFAAHDTRLSGPDGIHSHNAEANLIDTAMGLSGNTVISVAALAGEQSKEIMAADKKAGELYKELGPANEAFLQAFTDSPTTGMASLLDIARIRANFEPARGEDSVGAFNQYMHGVGSCPFLSLARNNSKSIDRKYPDPDEIVAEIAQELSVDSADLSSRINPVIPKPGDPAANVDIYIMRLSGKNTPDFLVNACTASILCKKEKKKRSKDSTDTATYGLAYKGFMLYFSMNPGVWDRPTAERIASNHFTTIPQWIINCSTASPL